MPAGALASAAGVIAHHVLELTWYPIIANVQFNSKVAEGTVLRLLHFQFFDGFR